MNKLVLNPLPYSYDALEPVISRQIMELHHDKHHAAYVNAANAAMEKPVKSREVMRDISFNANGAILHDFFWQNMKGPTEGNKAGGTLLTQIEADYGSYDNLVSEFSMAAVTVEGSGWAVLWKTPMGLITGQLEKHNLLGLNGAMPILVLDVWEHAYYLQYLNDRKAYVDKWWSLVNWDEVQKRFTG